MITVPDILSVSVSRRDKASHSFNLAESSLPLSPLLSHFVFRVCVCICTSIIRSNVHPRDSRAPLFPPSPPPRRCILLVQRIRGVPVDPARLQSVFRASVFLHNVRRITGRFPATLEDNRSASLRKIRRERKTGGKSRCRGFRGFGMRGRMDVRVVRGGAGEEREREGGQTRLTLAAKSGVSFRAARG